jgi:hypothetical protein
MVRGMVYPVKSMRLRPRKTEEMKGFSGEVVDDDETFLRDFGCEIKVAKVSGGRIR